MIIGFDPTFVDIVVRLFGAEGNLLPSLPSAGHHHRNCTIVEVAGGNGVNVARTLAKLGIDVTAVIPFDDYFGGLLRNETNQDHLKILEIPGVGSNRTVAVIWNDGELQLNSVSQSLGRVNWTKEIHQSWMKSPIHVFLNWGLNPLASEWVACQVLALSGFSWKEIFEIEPQRLIDFALKSEFLSDNPIFLDTGLLKEHQNYSDLQSLKRKIIANENAVLVCNEEEEKESTIFENGPFVVHSSQKVFLKTKNKRISIPVHALPDGERNFVGAGDAFLAGLIEVTLDGNDPLSLDSISRSINVAQAHILNDFSRVIP